MSNPIRVCDLVDQFHQPYGERPFLRCHICDMSMSANRADFWNANPEHVFTHCDENMMLVVKRTILEEVEPEAKTADHPVYTLHLLDKMHPGDVLDRFSIVGFGGPVAYLTTDAGMAQVIVDALNQPLKEL